MNIALGIAAIVLAFYVLAFAIGFTTTGDAIEAAIGALWMTLTVGFVAACVAAAIALFGGFSS